MEKKASELQMGESGEIMKISVEEPKKFKLMHFGVVPGSIITALYQSPFHDPTAYRVFGCVFAMREEDAKQIMVRI